MILCVCRYCDVVFEHSKRGRRPTICLDASCRSWALRAQNFNANCGRARCDSWMEFVDPYLVFERDGWLCHLCHESIDPKLPATDPLGSTVDHVIPRYLGGVTSYENCASSHRRCNMAKSFHLAA